MSHGVTADTLIATEHGDTPIAEMVEGDFVLTRTGAGVPHKDHYHPISKVFRRRVSGDELWSLHFQWDGCRKDRLTIMGEHSLKTQEGLWEPVVDLEIGARVLGRDHLDIGVDRAWVTLTSKCQCRRTATPYVYDLAVDGDAVYYANGVLLNAR